MPAPTAQSQGCAGVVRRSQGRAGCAFPGQGAIGALDMPGMGCTAPAGSVVCQQDESVFALSPASCPMAHLWLPEAKYALL